MAPQEDQKASIDITIESSSSSDANNVRFKTRRKIFKFNGAVIPSETATLNSIWNFYDPWPTRIARTESECEEWNDFFDKIDELLVPVNRSRRLVFAMTGVATCVVLVMVVGLFTFASALWSSNNLLLMALYALIGFSVVPVTLLITTRFSVPARVQYMIGKVRECCNEEGNRRSENERAKWTILFGEKVGKGFRIVVTISESSVSVDRDLCDMA